MKARFLLLSHATSIVLHIKYITLHGTRHEFQVHIKFLTLVNSGNSLLKHSECKTVFYHAARYNNIKFPPSVLRPALGPTLYLYSPSGPSRPVIGWPLPLPSVLDVSRAMTTKEKANTAFKIINKTGYKMSARKSYKCNDASSYFLILWTYIQ
jgi:hypothetical protein